MSAKALGAGFSFANLSQLRVVGAHVSVFFVAWWLSSPSSPLRSGFSPLFSVVGGCGKV